MNKEKLINPQNSNLYSRVRKTYKVNLKKSDYSYWGSHIVKDAVIISHSKTKHPITAFTHELLHIDTQLKGYRRIGGGVSLNKVTHQHLKRLCDCIDNEFQHQKMYKEFASYGFAATEFYADSDASLDGYLEQVLRTANLPLQVLVVDFLSLIAPGGSINEERKKHLLGLFYNYDGKKYNNELDTIKTVVEEWAECDHYDAEDYIKRFFVAINAGATWITYRDNDLDFPDSGYFTDGSFTQEELVNALNS